MSTLDEQRTEGPGLLVRAVWFLLIGWWAVGLWLTLVWALFGTILLAPLGVALLNYTPTVVALKPRRRLADGRRPPQRSLLVRGLWFLGVGWWAGAIWTTAAYLVTLTIVGLPVAVWMYGKLPAVVSLYRY